MFNAHIRLANGYAGVDKDDAQARKWLALAASAGACSDLPFLWVSAGSALPASSLRPPGSCLGPRAWLKRVDKACG